MGRISGDEWAMIRRGVGVAAVLSFSMVMSSATGDAAPSAPTAVAMVPEHWISGVWYMQPGYNGGGSVQPPRKRIARMINGEIPPLLPAAAAVLERRVHDAENGQFFANTASLCLPQGNPYMLYGAVDGPMQILETKNQVTFLSEEINEQWLIHEGRKHPNGTIDPTFHGDSIGHWEGDEYVIDSVAIDTKTTLDQVGMPHSDALHVITRLRKYKGDPNMLEFFITIDDPKTFAHPWDRHVVYKRAMPGEEIAEDHCENEHVHADAQGHQVYTP